jgi:hypothetical protein
MDRLLVICPSGSHPILKRDARIRKPAASYSSTVTRPPRVISDPELQHESPISLGRLLDVTYIF